MTHASGGRRRWLAGSDAVTRSLLYPGHAVRRNL